MDERWKNYALLRYNLEVDSSAAFTSGALILHIIRIKFW